MANESKKKKRRVNRRLKRSVMGTMSAVLMASAIIVAAIPVPESQAAAMKLEDAMVAEATADPSKYIPDYVGENYPVFASGDGNFRVAYGSNGGTMTGVINYYNVNNVVSNSALTIPSEINAFLYQKNKGEYVAVNGDKTFLYYMAQNAAPPVYAEDGVTVVTPATDAVLAPCVASQEEAWKGKTLYKVDGADGSADYTLVSGNTIAYTQANQLVIPVQYVGSTRYEVDLNRLNSNTEDGVYRTDDLGVFEGATNFATLVIPEKTLAIGNNAFKGCQMSSIKAESGVSCIGNGAFQDCNQLTTVGFVEPSNLKEIGDYAFAGCTYLGAVKIPDQVQKLGNCAFKDCTSLSAIGLNGVNSDGNTSLTTVGSGLFYNCPSLTQVVFPDRVNNIDQAEFLMYGCSSMTYLGLPNNAGTGTNLPVGDDGIFKYNNVTGCSALDTVKVPARDLKLDCDDPEYQGTGFNDVFTDGHRDIFSAENLGENSAFQDTYEVSDEFCVMAYSQSYAHTYTQKHGEAFGYLDPGYEGWYEKLVDGYAFRVDETNTLVNFEKVDKTNDGRNVIIPDNIAKYHVGKIASNTFQGNKEIAYLYIPESVSTIEAGAFKGCTELRTVNFDNALAVEYIGNEAFKIGVKEEDIVSGNGTDIVEKLCFIGDISAECVPFNYAMDTANNYNDPAAPTQYITYTSGFPQNLQIQMVVTKDENTNQITSAHPVVVAVPTEDQLKGNSSYSLSTYDGTSDYVRTKAQENAIVASANSKYRNNLSNPDSPMVLTEEEQAVIDAVYHVYIPTGIQGLKEDLFTNNEAVQSVIMEDVEEIPAGEFAGCKSLNTVIMNSSNAAGGEAVRDKAFEGCTALENVVLPETLTQMGSIPFAGCTKLTDVDFSGSQNFDCQEGIIKGLDDTGNLGRIIECLQARGTLVGPARLNATEFEGVTRIDPAAFQNCTGIREAYLEDSQVTIIPDYCFDGAKELFYCSLSDTTKSIGKYAFRNTALSTISVPESVQNIDDSAFTTEDALGNVNYIQGLTVECAEDSTAYWHCQGKDGLTAQTYVIEYTVKFYDWDGYLLSEQKVKKGASAVEPRAQREGYVLTGWTEKFDNVRSDIETQAIYEKKNSADMEGYYSVIFQDDEKYGSYIWDTQYVEPGQKAVKPDVVPFKAGYIFSHWSPSNFETIGVTSDMIIKANYTEDPNYDPNEENGGSNGDGTTGDNPSEDDSTGGNLIAGGTYYEVKFVDYNGNVLDTQLIKAGEYPVTTTVVPSRKGYIFTTWSPSNYTTVPVTSDITIKALYKKDTSAKDDETNSNVSSDTSDDTAQGSSGTTTTDTATGDGNQTQTGNTNVAGGGGTVTRPAGTVSGNASSGGGSTTYVTPNNGTQVVVTKSGISNKDLVSANISGANDNFVVKIADSTEARAAVEAALLQKYGSLDNLKYFAMDIGLYDSTGTVRVADTTGIRVTMTIPIPDVLVGYAGNNKIGVVYNGAFEPLNARLTSIDGVPCITFETTHFGPHAMYVETDRLTSGTIDATPTTGDPIHPKWFLSIGLAILSVLMFFGKGSKNKIVKVIE